MVLADLRVIHLSKQGRKASSLSGGSFPGSLHLDTCQRTLWVCTVDTFAAVAPDYDLTDYEVLAGTQAYSFLLRVCAGLESQVLGETDVFGQFKEAWRKSVETLESGISFWVQKILEDTKEVRSRHLQHLGGVSYGTLVRKFTKNRVTRGPTLLVGAGQLAQSVAPFLLEQEIWIINRSVENARVLAEALRREYSARVRVRETEQEQIEGWSVAAQAILCVPVDEMADLVRMTYWEAGNAKLGEKRLVLHLGNEKEQAGPWNTLENAFFLDDLFELQKAQGETRSVQVSQALKACDERAKLRALGNSVSIHHGWEDLAVFA